MTADLVAFLGARLDDDEQYAQGPWGDNGYSEYNDPGTPGHHLRVLAEVDAKRRLLDRALAKQHTVCEDGWYTCGAATEERDGGECCDEGRIGPCDCGRDAEVDAVLGLLALPYASHPDYRQEWAP